MLIENVYYYRDNDILIHESIEMNEKEQDLGVNMRVAFSVTQIRWAPWWLAMFWQ